MPPTSSPRTPTKVPLFDTKIPPRAWDKSEWALLPIRLFFGATFLFGGVQKLANPNFFRASSPISIQQQLKGSALSSPIGSLISPLQHVAVPLGVMIALAEIAIGVGTLLGLWSRVAAIGGALLSLNLFLTVSFHTSPYYMGSDIVFFFGWLALIVAGGGSQLSLDGWIARRAAATSSTPSRRNVGADPNVVSRRTVIIRARTATVVAGATVVGVGAVAGVGRALAPAKRPKTSGGPLNIGPATKVPVQGAATFSVPSNGDPGIVVCPKAGQFEAYDAVCPHAGCTVSYFSNVNLLICPCHGSQFDVTTGNRVAGPAPTGLTKLNVTQGPNGDLFVG